MTDADRKALAEDLRRADAEYQRAFVMGEHAEAAQVAFLIACGWSRAALASPAAPEAGERAWWAAGVDGRVLGPFRTRTDAVRSWGCEPWKSLGEVPGGVFGYRQALEAGASGTVEQWWVGQTAAMRRNGFALPFPASPDALAGALDVDVLVEAMFEAYEYSDADNAVPVLPFVDDHEAFWRPFAAKVLARLTAAGESRDA